MTELTDLERSILDRLAAGDTARDIAGALHYSEAYIRARISTAKRKMGARTRTSAVAQYVRERDGLVAH